MAAVLLTVIFFGARWLQRRPPAASVVASATSSSPAQQISPSVISKPIVSDGIVAATPRPAPAAPPQTHVPEPNAPDDPGVVPAAVVTRVLPDIPQAARDTVRGSVRIAIRVDVDSSGNVTTGIFNLQGPSGYFADRAMRAAKQWKFDPAGGHVPGKWLLRFKITRTSTDVFADTAD
jgi:hypothetical protein